MKFGNTQGNLFTDPKDAVRDVVKLIQMTTGLTISEPIDFGADPDYYGWSAKFKSWDEKIYVAKGDYFDIAYDMDEDEVVPDARFYATAELKYKK